MSEFIKDLSRIDPEIALEINMAVESGNDIHTNSLSGGRSSGVQTFLLEEKRKKEGWSVFHIFMDTGAEHPKTYEFIKNIAKNFGVKIICLRAVVSKEIGVGVGFKVIPIDEIGPDLKPFHDVVKKYGTPTINAPRCTSRLKSEPHDKFCDYVFGKNNYITWLGIRIDEPKRLKELEVQNDIFNKPAKKRTIRYLAEICNLGKSGVIDWWSRQSFDLEIPEHLGNCVFCIKKSVKKLALAAKQEPEMAKEFSDMLKHPETREMPKSKLPKDVIYRGYHSVDSIILLTKDIDEKDLDSAIKSSGGNDSNSCSESCEIYSNQMQMEL